MGTRSAIAEVAENGSVVASYCHYDGYISHTGEVLQRHYNTPELASQIARIGYASFLENTYEETKNGSVHKNESTITYESVEDFIKNGGDAGEEYLYLWDGEAWFVSNLYSSDHRFEALENFVSGALQNTV